VENSPFGILLFRQAAVAESIFVLMKVDNIPMNLRRAGGIAAGAASVLFGQVPIMVRAKSSAPDVEDKVELQLLNSLTRSSRFCIASEPSPNGRVASNAAVKI
jgi:hypothetical protein